MRRIIVILLFGWQGVVLAAGGGSQTAPLPKVSGIGVDANNHDRRKVAVHNGNKILTRFYNFGAIANWRIPGRYDSGIYPIGSGHSYLAEFTPIVAAEVLNTSGQTKHIVTDALVATTPFDAAPSGYLYQFQPVMGYANPNDSVVAMSDDTLSWPEYWPDRPLSWAGHWNGQYGQYARADQESYFHIDDYNNDEYQWYPFLREGFAQRHGSLSVFTSPDSSDYAVLEDLSAGFRDSVLDIAGAGAIDTRGGERPDVVQIDNDRFFTVDSVLDDHHLLLKRVLSIPLENKPQVTYTVYNGIKRGLGVDVAVRGYQWAHPLAEDILIWTYWIQNVSDVDYEKFVFGMYGDADVGDDGDQGDDDSWFDTYNDIVYQWDHDLWSPVKGGFKPAYFGWKYLESPGNPLDGVDNDEDGMIDESQFDGIDNDGDWNPITDDVGSDGIGPNMPEYTGPDEDGTEGNGLPDVGEPNFEITDNDESDQIGLTSFTALAWPGIFLPDDETTWQQLTPGSFMEIVQTVDITFMYGSAYFRLPRGQQRKFAVAMVFGEDFPDILRNAQTMQQIYNNDYNFARPPLKPRVTAVAGDHRVTLYWDDRAEYSRDPIYGYDFEGYKIFKATDPAFLESWVITDAYGNRTFNKPVAQFDRIDGLEGPHPLGINGLQMDMGSETGLVHSWTDSSVENGQTYYYAVVSYDQGYASDFYERGISDIPDLQPITPSECTKKITVNASGDVVALDINTVVVTPNAPALGYVPPTPEVHAGKAGGTGKWEVIVVDPAAVHDGDRYAVTFKDWSNDGIDNDGDWRTWTDDSLRLALTSTLTIIIPPSSDTLYINLPGEEYSYGIDANTTRFMYHGYYFLTTLVESETVTQGDTTYTRYFVVIPDTSLVIPPSLGLWNGWEDLHDDVGSDGCTDEYEDGQGGCSDTPLNLGEDPNGDNWNPHTNRTGTQANGRPDPGEPHLDSRDLDELVSRTSWYDVTNLTTGRTLLSQQTALAGEDRGLTVEGFRLNFVNDPIQLWPEQSGFTRSGLNLEAKFSLVRLGNYDTLRVPFDFAVAFHEEVTDTAVNMKLAAFDLYDMTRQMKVPFVYMPTENDVYPQDGASIYPFLKGEDEARLGWRIDILAKAAQAKAILPWTDNLLLFATPERGVAYYDGQHWGNITTAQGLQTNNITSLVFDATGRLIVGSTMGADVYNPTGWQSYSLTLSKQRRLEFTDMSLSADGTIWVATPEGVVRWDLSQPDTIKIIGTAEGLVQKKTTCIQALPDGRVAIGTNTRGVAFLNPIDTSFQVLDKSSDALMPSNNITDLLLWGDTLVIGTKQGLALYSLPDSQVVWQATTEMADKNVVSVAKGNGSWLYVATNRGFTKITFSDSVSFDNYTKSDIPQLHTDKITRIYEAPDGTLWVATKVSVARLANGVWDDFYPQPGDSLILKTRKPFSARDTLEFTMHGGHLRSEIPASALDSIAVVPNPYVVTASWEPQNLYASGRGHRKLDFIHLPPKCTIRIYTLSGKLVRKLEHESELTDGTESWDMLSRDGLEIAYGVYIYHVEAPGIGSKIGKFAVIK